MWESPKYRFRVPVDPDDDGYGPLKEIVLDVIGSAPGFAGPGVRLGGVLDKLLAEFRNRTKFSVLDLGAGKLRNALHVLQRRSNSHVWAVEYESLRKSSEQAQEFYKRAKGFAKRFHDMSFPHQFVRSTSTFDLILLINVLSIMPVPAERLLLLRYCYDRLKPNGHLLWYSQHGEPDYAIGGNRCNDATRCGDGFHIGGSKYEKTFFREFSEDEVDEMMLAAGLSFDRSYSVSRNLARVYVKRGPPVLTGLLLIPEIEAICTAGNDIPDPKTLECRIVERKQGTIEVSPESPQFHFDELSIERLESIPPGNNQATAFHRLAELVLRRAFRRALRKWETEREVDEGRKRIDLLAKNYAEIGFFDRVRDHYNIQCPYIVIECKNYTQDVANPEMDQLAGRLNPSRGQLGILVCRSIEKASVTLKRARDYREDKKYIIVLTDADLIRLCECVRDDDVEGINDLMETKLDKLLL
jgi:SAM-dependent methyltransferase